MLTDGLSLPVDVEGVGVGVALTGGFELVGSLLTEGDSDTGGVGVVEFSFAEVEVVGDELGVGLGVGLGVVSVAL